MRVMLNSPPTIQRTDLNNVHIVDIMCKKKSLSWELCGPWAFVIIPSLLDPKALKWTVHVTNLEKGWSIMIVAGFHRMARPPATPFESMWMELKFLQHR
jgi:hypothetical protein